MKPTIRFDRRAVAGVLAAATFAAFATGAFADAASRTTTLRISGHALKVEVAEKDAELERGLMFREKMAPNDGMLFIFEGPAYHAMWMKNTLIPLSVAFVDRDGTILNILDMEPQTLESHQSAGPSIYAIETNKGWFEVNHVKAGDKVAGLPKPRP